MDTRKTNGVQEPEFAIEYRGPAKDDAQSLAQALRNSGIQVDEPTLASDSKATMAIGEIVVTILATAAARALIDVTMDKLRTFLVSRLQGTSTNGESPNLQVLVKKQDGTVTARRLISLRVASMEFATKFVKEVGDAVLKAVAE